MLVCQYFGLAASGQIQIGKLITDRKLAWADFDGKVDAASPFSAMTNWIISYRSHIDSFHADTVFLTFQITPIFNNYTSWVKKEKIIKKKASEDLLQHEQGHYDLVIVCAETLRQTLNAATFLKSNYSVKVDSIANATLQLITQIENNYDEETNHMLNTDEQKRWNENIAGLMQRVAVRKPY